MKIEYNNIIKVILIIFIVGIYCAKINGQTKKSLEKERKEYEEKIKLMNNLLENNKSKQKQTVSNLKIVIKKIETRKLLIKNLEEEIIEINNRIKSNDNIIESLNNDLITLKNEYEKLIFFAYKNKKTTNLWLFIFASESFNKAYRRYKYFVEYTKYRKKQKELIISVNESLKKKNLELNEEKKKKQKLLFAFSKENNKLRNEINEKENMVNLLKKRENEIKKDIEKNKKNAKKIEEEIVKIIKRESEKSKLEKSENSAISNEFRNDKGKLQWPVSNGIIIGSYGESYHPVFKDVKIKNWGVDISTENNADVLSVFDGEVSGIYAISGANNTVLIKHGSFYTVYQNVVELKIKIGTNLKKGDIMGKVYTDEFTNGSVLHFEIWEGRSPVDPGQWIDKNN